VAQDVSLGALAEGDRPLTNERAQDNKRYIADVTDEQALHDAVVEWLRAVTDPDFNTAFAPDALTRVPEWELLLEQIATIATLERRPEMWYQQDGRKPRISTSSLLRHTGLSAVRQQKNGIDADAVAESLVAALVAPSPSVEKWWLTDVELRAGARIRIGEYLLETIEYEQLVDLAPLPPTYHLLPDRYRIDADLFQGSAFLHHTTDERPAPAGRIRFGHLTGRPELSVWRPLLPLMLWQRVVVRVEASWAVEPRRRIDVLHNNAHIDYLGEGDQEGHKRGAYGVYDEPDVAALAAFAAAVDGKVENILTPASGRQRTPVRIRRLQRSAEHLVQASQRSFYVGEPRDDSERDEILLHYVIAIESLLATEKNELTRRVSQRAAALFPADDDRLFVAKTVKDAYANRSRYAHGDATKEYNIEQIREVALAVMLRWIVLQATTPDPDELLNLLDLSLLSDAERRKVVVERQKEFFERLDTPMQSLQSSRA
jgi:hypothetical protein